MNTTFHIARIFRLLTVFLLISILLSMFPVGNLPVAYAQKSGTATPPPTNEEIEKLLEADFLAFRHSVPPGTRIVVDHVDIDKEWIIIAYFFDDETGGWKSGELAIGQFIGGSWAIISDANPNYNAWLDLLPLLLLQEDAKMYFRIPEVPEEQLHTAVMAATYSAHRLPWQGGVSHYVSRGVGSHSHPYEYWSYDFAMSRNTEIWASYSGVVAHIREGYGPGGCDPNLANLGNRVVINNDDGSASLYLHLEQNGAEVNQGQRVNRGDLVGKSGNSGYVCSSSGGDGAHLHFQVQNQVAVGGTAWWTQSHQVIFDPNGQLSAGTWPVSGNYRGGVNNPPAGFTWCADEDGRCSFSGTADVVYGALNSFTSPRSFTNGVDCNNGIFGDPINGTRKACYYKLTSQPPSGNLHVEYFNDKNLGSRCHESYENSTYVFKHWGDGAPANGCNSDNFSARFTGTYHFSGGNYSFHCQHDDGCRIFIDGQEKLNAWWDSSFTGHDWSGTLSGSHEVRIEFYDAGGEARLEAFWSGAGFLPSGSGCTPNEWCAQYFGNKQLSGTPAIQRNEGNIDIDYTWNDGSVGFGFPTDNFSARWQRNVYFASGRYRFHIRTDDGGRLWVNNNLVIDQWKDQGVTEYTFDADLGTGSVPLKFEYFENGGGAIAQLWWETLSLNSPPSAEFDAWPLSGTAPLTAAMHIVDLANISTCSWNYGDGQTSNTCTQVHNHTYNNPGAYTVSLTVNGPGGSDSMTRDDYIVVENASSSRPPAADFDGDWDTDLAIYRPSQGMWYVKDQFSLKYGIAGDIPVPGDYDSDRVTDVAVYRRSQGMWYVKDQFSLKYGIPGDIPVPGDYDGDGDTDLAIYRPSQGMWYVKDQFNVKYGIPGDIPVPGDYDGDGDTDVAIYRLSQGMWYVKDQFSTKYGIAGDIPIPGDYDGDGDTDVAIYRPSQGMWYVKDQFSTKYGIAGDLPLPGDFDGDGDTDVAIYRPSQGMWYVRNQFSVKYGLSTDFPLPLRDTNGDGDPYQ